MRKIQRLHAAIRLTEKLECQRHLVAARDVAQLIQYSDRLVNHRLAGSTAFRQTTRYDDNARTPDRGSNPAQLVAFLLDRFIRARVAKSDVLDRVDAQRRWSVWGEEIPEL